MRVFHPMACHESVPSYGMPWECSTIWRAMRVFHPMACHESVPSYEAPWESSTIWCAMRVFHHIACHESVHVGTLKAPLTNECNKTSYVTASPIKLLWQWELMLLLRWVLVTAAPRDITGIGCATSNMTGICNLLRRLVGTPTWICVCTQFLLTNVYLVATQI